MPTREATDTFCIAFDTEEMPGKVVETQVTLKRQIMSPGDSVNVAMVDHPLYGDVEAYVMANASEKK